MCATAISQQVRKGRLGYNFFLPKFSEDSCKKVLTVPKTVSETNNFSFDIVFVSFTGY